MKWSVSAGLIAEVCRPGMYGRCGDESARLLGIPVCDESRQPLSRPRGSASLLPGLQLSTYLRSSRRLLV